MTTVTERFGHIGHFIYSGTTDKDSEKTVPQLFKAWCAEGLGPVMDGMAVNPVKCFADEIMCVTPASITI